MRTFKIIESWEKFNSKKVFLVEFIENYASIEEAIKEIYFKSLPYPKALFFSKYELLEYCASFDIKIDGTYNALIEQCDFNTQFIEYNSANHKYSFIQNKNNFNINTNSGQGYIFEEHTYQIEVVTF